MMYADSYMTREEFRLMFDHTLYDKVSMMQPHDKHLKLINIKMNLLRYETNSAAEVTSQRSMTKSTRRLGQVGRIVFPKCFAFSYFLNIKSKNKLSP